MTTQPNPSPTRGVPAELEQMGQRIQGLTETLWAAREPSELMEVVAQIEALKTTLDALELDVVHELEATVTVKPLGWASTQDYLTHTTGGHKGTGPATVRLAAAVGQPVLAPVAEAMRDGWLSASKAHVIERAIDTLPGNPDLRARGVQVLLAEANTLDATELKKLTLHLLTVIDPDGDERRDEKALDRLERAAHLGRHLTITDDHAGGAWIKGRCTTEDAALIKATLIPLAAPQPAEGPTCDAATCREPGCGHDGRDPRDHGTRMLDALVEACQLLQSTEILPDCHGATPRITLTMALDDHKAQSGFGTTETGEQLSASAVRRLCCDAEVIPAVLGTPSEILDVGCTRRLVTPAIWKALVARDHHCRFPHCTRPPLMTHAHHITHWANGGPTSLDNLILLALRPPPPTNPQQPLADPPPWTRRVHLRPPASAAATRPSPTSAAR